jgi:hypothetical protein
MDEHVITTRMMQLADQPAVQCGTPIAVVLIEPRIDFDLVDVLDLEVAPGFGDKDSQANCHGNRTYDLALCEDGRA